jgi:hypothetical protein
VVQRTRKQGQFSFDLVFAMFFFMLFVTISRILFSIFDFVLTDFNTDFYVQYVWVWKIGMIFSQSGIVILLFILDKTVFKFKLKGLLAYIVAAAIIFQVAYPVNTLADFDLVSIFTLVSVGGSILLPIMFFYVGSRNTELKKSSSQLAWGIILYIVGAVLLLENIIGPLVTFFNNPDIRVYIYTLSTISKIAGLIFIYFGTSTFRS